MKQILIRLSFLVGALLIITACSDNTGEKLPSFNAEAISGEKINSKDLKGKIIVIKIWATWCGSCVKEIPETNVLVEKYKNDTSVVFIAITDDTKEKVQAFLEKHPFHYEHIVDATVLKAMFYPGIREEIPKHLVVDRDMKIVFDESGEIKNIGAILSDQIEKIK